jgi:surface polysaccharide O-acyltransferase-like enzyme
MRGGAKGSRAEVVVPAAQRDRFIDLVRVTSMVVVVLLHWLSVMPDLTDGKVVDQNVVASVPGLWPLTWTGDVMALFFFAGGYANWVSLATSLRRGESYAVYLARRVRRLLRPTFNFFGVWLAVDLLMRAVGRGSFSPLRHVAIGNTIPFGPLWFLGVYLLVVALSPWTASAHRRWGIAVPLAMVVGVAVADSLAFVSNGGTPLAANLLLVWLIPHQLGYFYADGSLRRLSVWACAGMAMTGLVMLAVLTSLPYYPRSLINPRWTVLTMDAPTLSLVADGLWLIGLALLLRRPAERLLADPGRWRVVSRANDLTMPVYLWHMTAYLVAVASLARLGAGFVYATQASAGWWWGRPGVMILSAAVLGGTLSVLGWAARLVRRTQLPVSP